MWWKVVLLCVVVCGAAVEPAEGFLHDVGENLSSQMRGVLQMATVNYSEPFINVTYVARVEFDMRAMGHLYNSSDMIIDAIANKQAYPPDIVHISDGHMHTEPLREHWRALLVHYAGPGAVLLVAALLGAVLPLAGLLWCCCNWCRSGRRRRPFDRKYDACLKGLLAILLICLLTLFLFGVVCAFATESQLEEGIRDAPDTLRDSIQDARSFLRATDQHARWLLVNNYKELESTLLALLSSSGMTVATSLSEFSRAVSVTTLTKMVDQLSGVRADLQAVKQQTEELQANAVDLNAKLRSVKTQLLHTLAVCSQPQCVRLQEKYNIGELDTEIPYNKVLCSELSSKSSMKISGTTDDSRPRAIPVSPVVADIFMEDFEEMVLSTAPMPNVSGLLERVSALLDSNIQAEVRAGQRVLFSVQTSVQSAVDTQIPAVKLQVTRAGQQLERVADSISSATDAARDQLQRQLYLADELAAFTRQYDAHRRYVTLGASVALLTMTVSMCWGLTCGVCGKRPDAYAADCCHKGQGARALYCGTALIFALGGLVSLVLMLHFVFGVAAQRFLCDPLAEPRGNRVFSDLEQLVDLQHEQVTVERRTYSPPANITTLMTRCHRNMTLYETLELGTLLDVASLRANLSANVHATAASMQPAFPSHHVTILQPAAKHKLQLLLQTGLSDFNFDRILDALETNMTSLSLDALATQLDSAAAALLKRREFGDVAAQLRDVAARLRQHHASLVLPMRERVHTLNKTATKLRDGLRFNHSSLEAAISYLMDETAGAETFLNERGPDLVRNLSRQISGLVGSLLDSYLGMLESAAQHKLARCGPLSGAFNSSRTAICRKILLPNNGYWMSLTWCVLLFIPLLVVVPRLARLYLHLDPYPGPLVEAEYLYDAYADRDNVPLANAYSAEKRGGRQRSAGGAGASAGRGGGGGGGGGGAAVAAPVDTHNARRYNDMAPKHWEEGPPRYHGPTEYERPPPYYYPGPADRQ